MSPILIRPVREQLEHDRVIRLLEGRWKRRFEVAINVGDEHQAPLKMGQSAYYPDLIFTSPQPPRRLQGVAEVETGESVNHLEALAEWAHFSKARAPFYLYVPEGAVEIARRLCDEHQIAVAELWTYGPLGDHIRFTLAHRQEGTDAPTMPEREPEPAAAAAQAAAPAAQSAAAVSAAAPAATPARPVAKKPSVPPSKQVARPLPRRAPKPARPSKARTARPGKAAPAKRAAPRARPAARKTTSARTKVSKPAGRAGRAQKRR